METFILAAVSLAIAVSTLFSRRREGVHWSFATLCLALCLVKTGQFAATAFSDPFYETIEIVGYFFLIPLLYSLTHALIRDGGLLPEGYVLAVVLAVLAGTAVSFAIFGPRLPLRPLLYGYGALSLVVCYVQLLAGIRGKPPGGERSRLVYLAVAAGATALLSILDLFRHVGGFAFPPLSNLFVAILLYFVYTAITHPRLMELKEFMARLLVKVLLTFAVSITLFVALTLFGRLSSSPFTIILLSSFLIIVAIAPTRQVLKALLNALFPGSREIFDFVYTFDRRLEQEKSVLLEEMAPVLAHEIRNPLASIKGAAQYLRSESSREEDSRLLDVIIEEVNRLNRVVGQFLQYARPYRPNLQSHDVNGVVAKALSIARMNSAADRVVFEEDLRSDLPGVPLDAEQMIQVILNMVLNALEPCPKEGRSPSRPEKYPATRGGGGDLHSRYRRGIRKEDLRQIFKPFFTTRERGVGLGLAICDRIVRAHGGHIRVKSLPGQGTIFHIRLYAER
jgi:signal transduction histidine kinase